MSEITAVRIILMVIMGALFYRTLLYLSDRRHEIRLRRRRMHEKGKDNNSKESNIIPFIILIISFILLTFLIIKIYIRGTT